MINNHVINLTDKNFQEIVLRNQKPVLVDFWAAWCGPCKMFAPILEEISQKYKNDLIVAKVNIDDFPDIGSLYSVKSIPTLLLFNHQELIATSTGMISKLEIQKFLNLHINLI